MTSRLPQVAQLQFQIEGALAHRFGGALSPRLKGEGEKCPVGIAAVDALLAGGLAVGGLSELVGAESSGRTTVAMSMLAKITATEKAAAWIDVCDAFDPTSAAQCGVDLRRLLWVRCADVPAPSAATVAQSSLISQDVGAASQHHPVLRGGGSPHPRSEAHGMPHAVAALLQAQPRSAAIHDRRARRIIGTPGAPNRPVSHFPTASPYREEQVPTDRMPARRSITNTKQTVAAKASEKHSQAPSESPSIRPYSLPASQPQHHLHRTRANSWHALEKALRCADLLLQAGGFSLLILDLGSVPPEMALRIPISTWFRFRAACERTRSTMVLITQHAIAKSSADMVVRMQAGEMQADRAVLTGIRYVAELERERNRTSQSNNVVPIRKPPQSERDGSWHAHATWAVRS